MASDIKTIVLRFLMSVNCYLVNTGDGFILIDSGISMSRKSLEKDLAGAGCLPGNLKLIIITHGDFDHTGNAAYLRNKYGARIAMQRGDLGMVEQGDMFWNRKGGNTLLRKLAPVVIGFGQKDRFTPDIYLDDGDDLSAYGFAARVVCLPGHSQGSIGILTAGGDLICGDMFMNDGAAPRLGYGNPADFQASVDKVKSLAIKTVYPGHGKPFPAATLKQRVEGRG